MANANSNSVPTLEPLVSRKRKLKDIMRNEPTRVTRYPILLSSTLQNNDVASNFFEVWVDDTYQEDFVYCQASHKIVTRQKRHNFNLVRHLKTFNHKSNKQNEDYNIPDVQMREVMMRRDRLGPPPSEMAS